MTEVTEPLNSSRSGTWRQVNKLLALIGLKGGGGSAFRRVESFWQPVVERPEFTFGT